MNDLTNEYQRLVRLEEVVDKGVRNMLDAADALKEIRDNKLYSERGYETFDLYLADEWGFGRNYINKIIRASEKRKLLGTTVPDSIVDQLGESHYRELSGIEGEDLDEVVDLASRTAKSEGKRITAKAIKEARDAVVGTTVPETPVPKPEASDASNPYGLPEEKLDQSRRIAIKNVDTLRRHLDFLGIKQYDNTLTKVRETLDK